MLPDPVRNEFLRILGNENLIEGEGCHPYSLGGKTPFVVLFPATLDEAAALSTICYRNSLAVVPWGGGTRMSVGRPPGRFDVAISTARMDAVLDYQPADMTVTVQGGLTLSRLQAVLAEKGQFLPLDPPHPDQATLGGIAAARDTGGLRHAYGSPRDLIIGLRVADPEGRIVKGGSKVVKNVAGYDLPKLYIGSWGTLGLIGEITFRVFPIPESRATVVVSLRDGDEIEPLLARLMGSDLVPAMVEWLSPTAAESVKLNPGRAGSLALAFDGAQEDVAWQVDHLKSLVSSAADLQLLDEPSGRWLRNTLADFPLQPDARFTLRVALLSSQVAEFAQAAERLASERDFTLSILAHAGVGLMSIHALKAASSPNDDAELIHGLRTLAADYRGSMTIERMAPELVGQIDPWPDFSDGTALMGNIKTRLDPKRLWSPERFVL